MIVKNILLTGFYLLLFNFLIYRIKRLHLAGFKPIVTLALFNAKFVTGIFIWAIYTFYYKDIQNNDVHKFYTDALVLRQAASENPTVFATLLLHSNGEGTDAYTSQMKNWQRNFDEAPINENQTIIRLNALLMFVSFKTYFVHILAMCFLSLIGWVLVFNSVFGYTGKQPSLLALILLWFPSVLFWTSGVMKEPVLVLGLGVFMYGLLGFKNESVIKQALAMVVGAIIILFIKFYVLACLLPAALAFMIFRTKESRLFVMAKYAVVYVVLLVLAFNARMIVPRIDLQQMLANKQMHSVKEAEYFKAGSRIDIPAITPDAVSIIKTAPVGIWNTVVRPYLWEAKNPMMLASAVENLIIVIIISYSLFSLTRMSKVPLNLVLFLLLFSLSYFALVGISTPVLGNLVRYRAPLLPFFLMAFICVSSFNLFPEKLRQLVSN